MPEKISLVYVVHNLLIGGAQDLVKSLALNVDHDRYDPAVASLINYPGKQDPEPITNDIRSKGVEVQTFYMDRLEDDEASRFIRFLKDRRVDVVHSHLYHADLWASMMAREAGVKAVLYSKHETYKNKRREVRIKNARSYNRTVDLALATSDITFRHLWSHEFIFPWKIRKVHNPVDTAYFDPSAIESDVRYELGIPQDAPVVGNIARLVARKGIDSFIRTCHAVSLEEPDTWFLLVGYGEKEQEYRELAADLGVKNLIFAGPRRDLPELFNTMDIFLFTPHSGEAFPMVMLEAMSMEKGIVASNVCSNPELIKDGISGLLPTPSSWTLAVDSLDHKALADAVLRLIREPRLRARIGRSARQFARERFDIAPVMRKLEGYYERILRKKGVLHGAR